MAADRMCCGTCRHFVLLGYLVNEGRKLRRCCSCAGGAALRRFGLRLRSHHTPEQLDEYARRKNEARKLETLAYTAKRYT